MSIILLEIILVEIELLLLLLLKCKFEEYVYSLLVVFDVILIIDVKSLLQWLVWVFNCHISFILSLILLLFILIDISPDELFLISLNC